MTLFKVLTLLEGQARKLALEIQSELIEHDFDAELDEGTISYNIGDPTTGVNVLTSAFGKAWVFHVPYEFPATEISIYTAKDAESAKHDAYFDGTFEMFSDPKRAVHAFLEYVKARLDENEVEPWLDPIVVRKVALDFQSRLLELDLEEVKQKFVVRAIWPWANGRDPELTVDLERLSLSMKREAITENGMKDMFGQVVLHVVIEGFVDAILMLYFSGAQRWRGWKLYHVDTDHSNIDPAAMLVHLVEYYAKKPNGDRVVEARKSDPTTPSGYTILSRFARQLVMKGFDAEVTSKSKPGIVNRSKLGIEVKGYGMRDTLKLYKPFWAHEKGMVAFVDAKTEQRFSSVEEMVEKLKARYPKLPKCLSFVPKPEKLKEEQGKTNIKKRLLKFQSDLIEKLPDDVEISDFIKVRGHAYGSNSSHVDTEFDRYVLVIKFNEALSPNMHGDLASVIAMVIDDLDTVVVNGTRLPPSEGTIVGVAYEPKGSSKLAELSKLERYEAMIKLDYSPKDFVLKNKLNAVYSVDEATIGRHEGLDELANWAAN